MNVSSVSALWNDQTSSVVSALKNSSDPTVSMFSKLLDEMMSNNSTGLTTTSFQTDTSAASATLSKAAVANSSTSAAEATGSAKEASHKWVSKMADHFKQTVQTGSANTLLPDDNQLNQVATGSIVTS